MPDRPSPSVEAITPSELSNKKETILADAILNGAFRFNKQGSLELEVQHKPRESITQYNARIHAVSEALLEGIETKSSFNISDNRITILNPSNNIMSILKELNIRVSNKENAGDLAKVGGALQEKNIENIIKVVEWQRDGRVAAI